MEIKEFVHTVQRDSNAISPKEELSQNSRAL